MKLKIACKPGVEQCSHAYVDAWHNEAGAGHYADRSISLAAGVPLSKNCKLQTSFCKRFVNHRLNRQGRCTPLPMRHPVDRSGGRRNNEKAFRNG
jgi:hypothetical protein